MVLIQRKYAGVGILLRKLQEKVRVGAPPSVNRLIWISHDSQVAMPLDNLAKQSELRVARVLEFVGHHESVRILDET